MSYSKQIILLEKVGNSLIVSTNSNNSHTFTLDPLVATYSGIGLIVKHSRDSICLPQFFPTIVLNFKNQEESHAVAVKKNSYTDSSFIQDCIISTFVATHKPVWNKFITQVGLDDVSYQSTASIQTSLPKNFTLAIQSRNPVEINLSLGNISYWSRPLWHYEQIVKVNGQTLQSSQYPIQLFALLQSILGKLWLGFIVASAFIFTLSCLLLIPIKKYSNSKYHHFEFLKKAFFWCLLIVCFALSIVMIVYVHTVIIEKFPHTQDELTYLFQAKALASGKLAFGSLPNNIRPFFSQEFIIQNDLWFGKYPPGWPFVLSIGILLGQPLIILVLLCTINLLLVYKISTAYFSRTVSAISLCILSTSPFFILQSASFFSHSLSLTLTLAFIYTFGKYKYVLAGCLLGFELLVRPYNAFLLLVSVSIYVFIQKNRFENIKKMLLLIPGVVVALCLTLFYNKLLTHQAFVTPQQLYSKFDTIGFGQRGVEWGSNFSILQSLNNFTLQFYSLTDVVMSFAPSIFVAFIIIGISGYVLYRLQLKTKNYKKMLLPEIRESAIHTRYLIIITILVTLAGYLIYHAHGIFFGPRYWFEIFPLIVLCIIGGVVLFIKMLTDYARSRIVAQICLGVLFILLFSLAVTNFYHLVQPLKGVNSMTHAELDSLPAPPAIIAIPSNQSWQQYGKYFLLNEFSNLYQSDYIFVRHQGLDNMGKNTIPIKYRELQSQFPERKVYLLNSDGSIIQLLPDDSIIESS